MEIRADILLIALGGAFVTILPRVAPLVLLSRTELPQWLRVWLGYVPVSILAALLASELLVSGGRLVSPAGGLIAVAPAFLVAARLRSIIGAVLAGVATMAVLRALGG